jgi:hypothetical protein
VAEVLRNVRRYRAAERACRALRAVIANAHSTPAEWGEAVDHLSRWISLSGKDAFVKPRPIRKARR